MSAEGNDLQTPHGMSQGKWFKGRLLKNTKISFIISYLEAVEIVAAGGRLAVETVEVVVEYQAAETVEAVGPCGAAPAAHGPGSSAARRVDPDPSGHREAALMGQFRTEARTMT